MPKRSRKDNNPLVNYVYYSNLAIEMGVIIAAGVFGGLKLDEWLNVKPAFTVTCSLTAIGIALYIAMKDFIHPSRKKDNEKNDTH